MASQRRSENVGGWAAVQTRSVTGMRWTGLPDRNTDQIGTNVRQMSEVIQEPLPLKPGILVKRTAVLVKRKMDLLKPAPGQKPWKNKEKSV